MNVLHTSCTYCWTKRYIKWPVRFYDYLGLYGNYRTKITICFNHLWQEWGNYGSVTLSPFPRDTRHKCELESNLHQNMHKKIERHAAQAIVSWPKHKHRRIFSPSIEKGGHWSWPSRSFWPFWPRMFGIRFVCSITCNGFLPNNTKYEPNKYFGILSAGTENGGHWPGPSRSFDHFDSEFQETTFNIALVYWLRPAPLWLYRIQIQFPIKNKVHSWQKRFYTPGGCVFFVIISISSVREV